MPRSISSAAPVGSTIKLPAATAPSGYLYCDGSAVSRTTYAGLFAVIGIAHGSGNGSTTFNIPDYRGYFLRGVDNGAGRDPDTGSRTAMNSGGNVGDLPGSVQAGQYASHSHGPGSLVTGSPNTVAHVHIGDPNGIILTSVTGGNQPNAGSGNHTLSASGSPNIGAVVDEGLGTHTHTVTSGLTATAGGTETRGINAYTNVFIRY